MTLKASDISFGSGNSNPLVKEHIFRERGEQRYSLELLPAGIVFEVDRLRRESKQLWGELSVSVNGQFPKAMTVNGVLSLADFNFSSAEARTRRAKILSDRVQHEGLDWHGFVEELAIKIIQAERKGRPAVVLADSPDESDESRDTLLVSDFPLLRDLPMVIFGDGSSGKSYFAMWLTGSLAQQGVTVLYADWEFDRREHKKRLNRLFQPMPKNVIYARCDRPLVHDLDRLRGLVLEHKCQYIVCDSIGFAMDGPAESQEGASAYFRAIRQLGLGSLNIAHIPKQSDDGREAQIFGSAFFKYGARSVWFIQRATDNPKGQVRIGLYHRKSNTGDLLAARGFQLLFEHDRTRVETVAVASVDELAAGLPLLDRMKKLLKRGAIPVKVIAEELNISQPAVRTMLSRHQSSFVRVGKKIGLIGASEDF